MVPQPWTPRTRPPPLGKREDAFLTPPTAVLVLGPRTASTIPRLRAGKESASGSAESASNVRVRCAPQRLQIDGGNARCARAAVERQESCDAGGRDRNVPVEERAAEERAARNGLYASRLPIGWRASALLIVFDGSAYLSAVPTPVILDNLIAGARIPPVVAVFIDNPNQETRTRELTPNPEFAEFLARELLPWVHARYHVTSDPRMTVVAGSSFGGLAATYAALRHPEVFGNVLCQSGDFSWAPDHIHAMGKLADAMTETGWFAKEFIKSPPFAHPLLALNPSESDRDSPRWARRSESRPNAAQKVDHLRA
jgi:hypothetical protein